MTGLALVCAAVLAAGTMAGCGKTGDESGNATLTTQGSESTTSSFERIVLKDLDVDQYVTLGDYKSIRVTKPEAKVDDADLQQLLDDVYLNSFPAELGVKDRAVVKGDTANIDYVGKKDGVAFDGGTAQDSNLTIGSHTFIDGFEDGLVGVMPGETVDLNLTFPANYGNTDLAGQAVVFTVTVNYIIPEEKMDEAVKSFGVPEVTNLEELRQYIYDYLLSYAESENDSLYEEDVVAAFMEVCDFKNIPDSMYQAFRETTKQNIVSVAAGYNVDAETYINYIYQTDLQTFLEVYGDNALKQNIAMQAVANREGLNVDDQELQDTLLGYAVEAGFDTVEEYIGDDPIEDFREYFVYEKVYNYLMEIAQQK